jgi:hypothetical protein
MKFRQCLWILLALTVGLVAGGSAGVIFAEHQQRGQGADAALLQADQSFRNHKPAEALQLAFAAIDRRPDFPAAYELSGDILANAKSHDLAESFYQQSLAELKSANPGTGSAVTAKTPQQIQFERERMAAKLKQFQASNSEP